MIDKELDGACDGGPVIGNEWSGSEMIECCKCGMQVRWDLENDDFYGFAAGCPFKKKP